MADEPRRYVIYNANDEFVCDSCRAFEDKIFDESALPEIPNPNCTSEFGCRCQSFEYIDVRADS